MSSTTERWIVVGLGNPGDEYARTRHNVGAMVVEDLAKRHHVTFSSHRSGNRIAEFKLGPIAITLAKPNSYMNSLGPQVRSLRDFYSLENSHLIALHDELDIDFAAIRIKFAGGENGHNGLKSMTASLGGPEYFRIRLGIGRPPGRQDPADFVLKNFSSQERDELASFIDRASDAVESLIKEGLERSQSTFNS
jgi:PTH1 family peptidyl-tRNA hydrolase